jgi:alkanesulfonate monooxygenase SsuD/methylene tetrahydromethanopterin reductase-like flavin-dependent oxidoreductase (luciferase family)
MQLTLVSDSYESAKAEYQEGVEFFYQKLLGSTGRYFPEAPGYRTEASIRAGFERSLALAQESTPQAGRTAPPAGGPSWDQLVEEGNIVAGSPDEVAEKLREISTSLRVGHVLPLLQIGNMRRETTMKNIKMFGEEVLPQIHDVWDDEDWEDRWSPRPLAQRVTPAPIGG